MVLTTTAPTLLAPVALSHNYRRRSPQRSTCNTTTSSNQAQTSKTFGEIFQASFGLNSYNLTAGQL